MRFEVVVNIALTLVGSACYFDALLFINLTPQLFLGVFVLAILVLYYIGIGLDLLKLSNANIQLFLPTFQRKQQQVWLSRLHELVNALFLIIGALNLVFELDLLQNWGSITPDERVQNAFPRFFRQVYVLLLSLLNFLFLQFYGQLSDFRLVFPHIIVYDSLDVRLIVVN